jgi:hypothetical protein
LKNKVYITRRTELITLKQKIREEIAQILEETFGEVMHSFSIPVHLCIQEGGGHPKDIVHKK